jgi:ribosomal protein S18 acetylase RimI-like enzyme
MPRKAKEPEAFVPLITGNATAVELEEGYAIRDAVKASDHKAILQLAKKSPYTKDFGNHMFSGDAAYEKGWIRIVVALADNNKDQLLYAFYCVRHKVRDPETSLYFIGVDPLAKKGGFGRVLIEDIQDRSPHTRIVLNVMNDNKEALAFYERLGFTVGAPALKGKGVQLSLEWSKEESES